MDSVSLTVGVLALVGANLATWLSRGAPSAARYSAKATWPLSLVSGLVLWLAYFPADCGWLAWVALVPWLVVLHRGTGHVYWASFLAGCLFGLLALQWMRCADPLMYLAWIGLAVILGVHWWLFAVLVRQLLRGGWPLPFVTPIVWVSLEWARANVDIGFSWYFLAHTQHAWLAYLGLVPITGAYGISGLVMLANAVLAEALNRLAVFQTQAENHPQREPINRPTDRIYPISTAQSPIDVNCLGRGNLFGRHADLLLWIVAGLAFLLANPLLAKRWPGQFPKRGGAHVVIVQTNEPQEVRNAPSEDRQQRMIMEFRQLVLRSQKLCQTKGKVDLVIWPETSMPFDWVRVLSDRSGKPLVQDNHADAQSQSLVEANRLHHLADTIVQELARLVPTWILVGVNSRLYLVSEGASHSSGHDEARPFRVLRYNSALLISPGGHVVGRYDKIYRVPFGEYLPLRDWLPWISWLSPYEYEYSILPGEAARTLALGESGQRLGVLICYEDTVPHLPRKFFHTNTAPDFFVNISNDGWFKGSEEHEQHLAIARFRAAETRRALVRSVNMGISAVIQGDGAIVNLPASSWSESKARVAVFTAKVPVYSGTTFYVRWGDWFAGVCGGMVAILLAISLTVPGRRCQSSAAGSG